VSEWLFRELIFRNENNLDTIFVCKNELMIVNDIAGLKNLYKNISLKSCF